MWLYILGQVKVDIFGEIYDDQGEIGANKNPCGYGEAIDEELGGGKYIGTWLNLQHGI